MKFKEKSKAIVCDLDNTLFDVEFIFREFGDWEHFYKNCNSDKVKVIPQMKKFIDTVCSGYYLDKNNVIDGFESYTHCERKPYSIFFSTARDEKCREETENKLFYEGIHWDALYMRKEQDFRPTWDVKRDHLREIMKNYDVIAFIDDDIDNCKMAKELGILALRAV